jgi:hypothetical protein
MNPYRPGPSRSRGLADRMERRPLTTRLILMLGAFLLLIPIAGIIRGSGTNVVKSGGLPGAAVAADPLLTATTATGPGAALPDGSASSAAPPVVSSEATPATSAPPAAAASDSGLTAQATSPPTTTTKSTTTPVTTAAKKKTATTPATTAAKKTPATTAGSKATSPPTTKAPATTAATSPPKTQAPTTTAPPAAAPPPNTYSKADVEAIIRSIWPADLADEAVRIARRESNLVPTVRNWCCFGLFQIYFEMNKKTLNAVGVTVAEQLYDPRVNAEAAYAIYQRSGWGPWGA